MRWVADLLGWELTAPPMEQWLSGCLGAEPRVDSTRGGRTPPSSQYSFSAARAGCLWANGSLQRSLDTFSLVVVADTAAVARTMLQHGWPPPGGRSRLFLWICNRFDYGVVGDDSYYSLFKELRATPTVALASSARFEILYARHVRGELCLIRHAGVRTLPCPATPIPRTIHHAHTACPCLHLLYASVQGVELPSEAILRPLGKVPTGGGESTAVPASVDQAWPDMAYYGVVWQ